ncbi:MAG: phosphoribosylamine--glycine ligase [Acidobacteria bacterium RIFCSPLOWO2_02_FULL_59_13]|nr:MAG: phosphoribosylamine--glycine ligase [Acidobacteria bacterium RIFCSPLOWO2_02_FULL_59_13]
MKVLVIGSGGREHALVWKLRQRLSADQVYCVPGNGGIAGEAQCLPADLKNPRELAQLAAQLGVDLTVVGPEAPLVAGLADEFQARGLPVAGPVQAAAQLEGSKIFAKQFMRRHRIPTADFVVCEDLSAALANLDRWGGPVVMKADGLAAGKGVIVASERSQAEPALEALFSGRLVGDAGKRVILEQRLAGEEVSFLVLTDGTTVLPLAPTQDHKAVWDSDQGPNTGGMGAYCDDAILSGNLFQRVLEEIVGPTLDGLRSEGILYKGVLYCGLMMTGQGPQVLEYNVRLGDPEAQALLFRLRSDLAQLLLAVATGNLRPDMLSWEPGSSVCVVACSEGYPGEYATGREITGLAEAERNGAKVFHAGTSQRDGKLVTSGGRVLGITARGPSLATATEAAYEAASRIRFQGMHYRRDIAQKGLQRLRPLE